MMKHERFPAAPDRSRSARPTGAGYTVTMRVLAPHDPTLLPRLAEIVSDAPRGSSPAWTSSM